MSDHALDIHLDKQDRFFSEVPDEREQLVWCGWGKHYVPASEMVSEYSFECKACEAEFEADCAEVEQMFVEFGGDDE